MTAPDDRADAEARAQERARIARDANLELFAAAREAAGDRLREELAKRLLEEAGAWIPYPVDALPRALQELARQGADAIGCDASRIALAALVVSAGAIGTSRDVRIKRSWREPSVLWGCIIGGSGERKSPALDLAEAPLLELEAMLRRTHERRLQVWERACTDERALAKRERRKPELRPRSACERLLTKDCTIEALARILPHSPEGRGLTVARDELRAWIKSWGEYKASAGGDAAKWLELYGARALITDRVADGGSVFVPRAAVSVVGCTTPGILRREVSREHVESGCAARILFAAPPRRARTWTDADIDDETTKRYARVVRALTVLAPRTVRHPDGGTSHAPEGLPLSPGALALFRAWVDELGLEALVVEDDEAATASKIEGVAARLALVLELISAAEGPLAVAAIRAEDAALAAEAHAAGTALAATEGEPGSRDAAAAALRLAEEARQAAQSAASAWGGSVREVSESAMRRGIVLARWHWAEGRRVLAIIRGDDDEDPKERARRELVAWIRARGGKTTARELERGPRRYRTAGAAQAALDELEAAGLGAWTYEAPPEGGGHSARVFVLAEDDDAQRRPTPGDTGDGDTRTADDPRKAASVAVATSPAPSGLTAPPPANGHPADPEGARVEPSTEEGAFLVEPPPMRWGAGA